MNTLELAQNPNTTSETLVYLSKDVNFRIMETENINTQIDAQKATLTALNQQRNEMLHEVYSSQFAYNIEVLEYFELFEVQHKRRVTVYYSNARLLKELEYNSLEGYYTKTALYYILKMYGAKMIAQPQIITLCIF